MKKTKTHDLVRLALLTAFAAILYMLEFPIIPGTPLRVDLSDLIVIIVTYFSGFKYGIILALLKNILHLFFITRTSGIAGEIANFAYALFISLPIIFYRKKNQKVHLVLGVVFAAFSMHFFNAWVTFPIYGLPNEGKHMILIKAYLPFNLIKGAFLYFLFAIIKPYLKKSKIT